MWHFSLISIICLSLCGCSSNFLKNATQIDYITSQYEYINLYINKTTEEDIISLLGLPIERVEYFESDGYKDDGYHDDIVKHVKLTFNCMYRTKSVLNENHIQVINHPRAFIFHNTDGQKITQYYETESIDLIIHNGKLRGIPDEDGHTYSCIK